MAVLVDDIVAPPVAALPPVALELPGDAEQPTALAINKEPKTNGEFCILISNNANRGGLDLDDKRAVDAQGKDSLTANFCQFDLQLGAYVLTRFFCGLGASEPPGLGRQCEPTAGISPPIHSCDPTVISSRCEDYKPTTDTGIRLVIVVPSPS